MSEEELTLVIEMEGVARKDAAKVLEAIKATLETLRFESLVSGGKRGVPKLPCHGFLFEEPPRYDPLPFDEVWDEKVPAEEVDLISAHARALRTKK